MSEEETPSWLDTQARMHFCPMHLLPLHGRIIEVHAGLHQILRKSMAVGICPHVNCKYMLEICLDHTMVVRESW